MISPFGSVAAVMNAGVTGQAREILSAIGAGGMDEVYRATRVVRDVPLMLLVTSSRAV